MFISEFYQLIMQFQHIQGLVCFLAIFFAWALPTWGQTIRDGIGSDTSLPHPTLVNKVNNNVEITGGTVAGDNLFHSFKDFNVPAENTAIFINNLSNIKNIIGRVTGTGTSEILGTLEAGGNFTNFNLFLINPNGIIFGPQSRLNLQGSFVATTADAVQFGTQGFFSATEPNNPALLTVHPSAFIFQHLRTNPISVQSTQLQVIAGKSLLLLGGDISIQNSKLDAPSGQIELGGLATTGKVELNVSDARLTLNFPESAPRANILLKNQTEVSVNGNGQGSIIVNANNLDIIDGSSINAGLDQGFDYEQKIPAPILIEATDKITIQDSFISNFTKQETIGDSGDISLQARAIDILGNSQVDTLISQKSKGNAGNITLIAQDRILISATEERAGSPLISTSILAEAEGRGGDLFIQAGSLFLSDGSQIVLSALGTGNGGDAILRVTDTLSLEKATKFNTFIRTSVEDNTIGNAGKIDIIAGYIILKDGSQLITSNQPNAQGRGGDIFIKANTINISGTGNGFSSGIFAEHEQGARGGVGNITIDANTLSISEGGIISVTTRSPSDGSNIRIIANIIAVKTGGQILSQTAAEGRAGNINLDVAERIILTGSDPTFTARLEKFGAETVTNNNAFSGIFANTINNSLGNGGNISLQAREIDLNQGALIEVSSQGLGQAGNIQAQADFLTLTNLGRINADSLSGDGGNISLQIRELLLMDNSSLISATAAATGTGGNININSQFLLAEPQSNSDITANAFGGAGGAININSQGIFGLTVRDNLTPDNDITAFSQFQPALNGLITLNTPEIDPSRGLISLPETVIDPNSLIAQNPCKKGTQSQLTQTGRGGLPPQPGDDLSPLNSEVNLVEAAPPSVSPSIPQSQAPPLPTPAQGWVYNEQGLVVLTAENPLLKESLRSRPPAPSCSPKL